MGSKLGPPKTPSGAPVQYIGQPSLGCGIVLLLIAGGALLGDATGAAIGFGIAGVLAALLAIPGTLARRALGKISLFVDAPVLLPGNPIPVRLTSTPQRTVRLMALDATLRCQAVTRAGSRKRAARIEVLHEGKHRFELHQETRGGTPLLVTVDVPIPPDAQPTLNSPTYKVSWSLTLRLEVLGCPDWTAQLPVAIEAAAPGVALARRELLLVLMQRREALGTSRQGGDRPTAEALQGAMLDVLERRAAATVTPASAAEEAARSGGGWLESLYDPATYSWDRRKLAEAHAGEVVEIAGTVRQVEHTLAFDVAPELRDGRTLQIEAAPRCLVNVRFPASRNAELDALGRDAIFSCRARVRGWSGLYDRLELDATH